MTLSEFQSFYDRSLTEFAKQYSEDTDILMEQSLLKAQAEILKYFPDGFETKDQHVYHLKNEALISVGYLWFGIQQKLNKKNVFIYDLLIEEPFRGLGYSKIILKWLELETKQLGIKEISLHVLGYNDRARALYQSCGFEITNLYMSKKI